MSQPSANSSSPLDVERLQLELGEKIDLVQTVRQELIRSQITVLELQDAVLQKETDKADAVALLGQAELVLESRINYIFELDRILNQRIAALERELSETRSANESVVNDLVAKLDSVNRELGAAHSLAAGYAREAAETREQLAATTTALDQSKVSHAGSESALATTRSELRTTQSQLASTVVERAGLQRRLHEIHQSTWWKLGSLFRPKNRGDQ
jgi:hypothetical protein